MCGIIGITHLENASTETYKGLLLLQHRGQDSAGILSYETESKRFHLRKDLGLVSNVFSAKDLTELKGQFAIGHTRYSTVGKINTLDIQPMLENYPYGTGAVHNGNIENIEELRLLVESTERYLSTNNDLEVLMHTLSKGMIHYKSDDFFKTLLKSVDDIFKSFKGGYSYLSIIAGRGLLAFRDVHGIRPLILGKKRTDKGESFLFTSETNVLSFLGYEFVRDVLPGEVIFIDEEGNFYSEIISNKKSTPCMFEWIYFSSAESTWQNRNMYEVRLNLGEALAKKISELNLDIDLVSPIPDTSRSAAISLAECLKLPYREVLIKNRYVQRSFILNTQEKRNEAVRLKFSVVRELVAGKNILLVDDSIVRGTTSKKIVELIKSFGANKIYLASTCPPIKYPCFYGIAFPSPKELVMNEIDEQGLSNLLGCDGVFFTDQNDLKNALNINEFCHGCLDGVYPYDDNNK
jgi:amidophosphoribosyltransferase